MNVEVAIRIAPCTFDQMMPMHLVLDAEARISHAGPTITKVLGGNVVGRSAFSLFELRRPRSVTSIDDVRALGEAKIYLRLKDGSGTTMVGALAILPGSEAVLMNLSFGYSVVDAVARYKLAGSDFAPTDLTVEMLYLMEAKTAAMEATTQMAYKLRDEKAEAQVEATTDGLTGLRNRRAFDDGLEYHIARGVPFSLMHIDLDFFKAVNDTLGHAAGDAVLTEVARVLSEETRDSDTVARVGGDEFVILFGKLSDEAVLERIAARVIKKIERPIPFGAQTCQISASIGIVRSAIYDTVTAEQLAADADLALYASKGNGRACFTVYKPSLRSPNVAE